MRRRDAVPHAFSMGPSIPAIGAALASAELHKSAELHTRQDRLRAVQQVGPGEGKDDLPIKMICIGDAGKTIDI